MTLEKCKTGTKTKRPISLRTQGHYLGAWKSFTRWLTNVRHAYQRDPLAAVKKPNFAADRRVQRRFLHPEEWQWLAKTRYALLYRTAIETGFRASEIRMLDAHSLRRDHLFLPAKYTKNKQDARQYITPELRDKLAGALPFPIPDKQRLAQLLYRDLAFARWLAGNEDYKPEKPECFLQRVDVEGNVCDFHALRHSCGAWLAIAGVNPKEIQRIMRHSSISLTLDTYGHLMPGAEQDAIQHFRAML